MSSRRSSRSSGLENNHSPRKGRDANVPVDALQRTSRSLRNSSNPVKYVDDSDSEMQLSDDQQPQSRPRRNSSRPTQYVFEPLITYDNREERRSRDKHSNHNNHQESRATRSRRRFDNSPTIEEAPISRRSSNKSRHSVEVTEDPSDIEEEEEEEEEGPRTYSLRDRSNIKRETPLNISHLGGDGKTYLHDPHPHHVPRSYGTERPSYREPRLHLGGRIAVPSVRRHHHHHRRHHHKSYRRHFDSSSDSDSDSSNDHRRSHNEDDQFRRHELQRMEAERDSILPLSMLKGMGGSVMDKASRRDLLRADIVPIAVEAHIGFNSVGGLEKHVQALKEMVVLPLLYPDVFQQYDTQPPRGVLFCGPPGTGKTLTARALANSLSSSTNWSAGGKKVSFFMRKGADCLSKWVGEGERQLRLLFEQAKRYQPSIIFFDEIDGLAPVRSVKQDQIHASIVSTLLALMDGLDSRGQVVVIGATNRPDAIDSALRRPGRFDRELTFPLPDSRARGCILDIHTGKRERIFINDYVIASWQPPLSEEMRQWIINATAGYCGADMKALCSEAALVSLRRTYPQVYESNMRLRLDTSKLHIGRGDFAAAMQKIVPSARRSLSAPGKPLEVSLAPLLQRVVDDAVTKVRKLFPPADKAILTLGSSSLKEDEWIASLMDVQEESVLRSYLPEELQNCKLPGRPLASTSMWDPAAITHRSQIMLFGPRGSGHADVAGALIHSLEMFPLYSLDFASILSDVNFFSIEQTFINRIQEAKRNLPCIVYMPDIVNWWIAASDNLRMALYNIIESLPSNTPMLWITSLITDKHDIEFEERFMRILLHLAGIDYGSIRYNASTVLAAVSQSCNVVNLAHPSSEERRCYFASFMDALIQLPATIYAARKQVLTPHNTLLQEDDIPIVEPEVVITESTSNEKDKNYLREQRVFFRAALSELLKEKRFQSLWRPVDPEQVPDYYDIIKSPMDIETMRAKVDEDLYPTYQSFLYDLQQIIHNAREYNPLTSKDSRGRAIVSSAHNMLDVVESHAFGFKERLGYDVFKKCEEVHMRNNKKIELPADRNVMPEENYIFYRFVLERHEQVKEEMGDEHPSALKENEAATNGHDDNLPTSEMTEETPGEAGRTRRLRGSNDVEFVELTQHRKKKQRVVEDETEEEIPAETLTTPTVETSEEPHATEMTENVEQTGTENVTIEETLDPLVDVDTLPIIVALKESIVIASQYVDEDRFNALTNKIVGKTEQWSLTQLSSLLAMMNRRSRLFHEDGDFCALFCDLNTIVDEIAV